MNSPSITSLLYYQGAILASRKTNYADILKADCLEEVVRELMMEQHKQMIRDLMQGRLNLNNAPRESTYTPSKTPIAAPAPARPKQEKPVAPASQSKPEPPAETKEKSLDDIILDFLAQEQKERSRKK